MDNEVSICSFYTVIRNCHTPFHFLVSLGSFARMRLPSERNWRHQTGTQSESVAVTRGPLPPHGQEASGRYWNGPEHHCGVARCSQALSYFQDRVFLPTIKKNAVVFTLAIISCTKEIHFTIHISFLINRYNPAGLVLGQQSSNLYLVINSINICLIKVSLYLLEFTFK